MPPLSGCYYKDSLRGAIVTELAPAINRKGPASPHS